MIGNQEYIKCTLFKHIVDMSLILIEWKTERCKIWGRSANCCYVFN